MPRLHRGLPRGSDRGRGLLVEPDLAVELPDDLPDVVVGVWSAAAAGSTAVETLVEEGCGRAKSPANAPTATRPAAANQPVRRDTLRRPRSRRSGALMTPLSGLERRKSARDPLSSPSSHPPDGGRSAVSRLVQRRQGGIRSSRLRHGRDALSGGLAAGRGRGHRVLDRLLARLVEELGPGQRLGCCGGDAIHLGR